MMLSKAKSYPLSFKNKLFIFLGDFFDHGDLYFFVTFMPLLGPIFFPTHSFLGPWLLYWVSNLLAYPLGAWIFGHMAQQLTLRARRNHEDPQQVVIPLLGKIFLGLSLCTFIIGLLPSYKNFGPWAYWAPCLLLFFRTLQCFFARGQRSIGHLFLLSEGTFGSHILRSMGYELWTLASLMASAFLASYLLKNYTSPWAWRCLFLIAGSLGAFISLFFIGKKKKTSKKEDSSFKDDTSTYTYSPQDLSPLHPLEGKNHDVSFSPPPEAYKACRHFLYDVPPMFLWFSLSVIGGFSYVPYALAFHFLPYFMSTITKIPLHDVLRHTGYLFLLDMTLVLLSFGCIFLLWTYKTRKENSSLFSKETKSYSLYFFIFLSKALRVILHLWCLFLPLGFFLIYFQDSLLCFKILRFFIIITGVVYSSFLYLWRKTVHSALGEDYKILGVTQSFGTLIMGHSIGFICHCLFHFFPYSFLPGLYAGGLGFVVLIVLKKLLSSIACATR